MPTLFENKSGFVVRTKGESATKALLRVTGLSEDGADPLHHNVKYETLFVTSLTIGRGVNSNVAYSLDNHIFLSAAGDRLGTLNVQGLVFGSVCGATGQSIHYGTSHGGLSALTSFYNKHKLLGGREGDTIPKVEIVYTGQADWDKCIGYMTGVTTKTSDVVSASMDFTLDCLLVP